MCTSLSLGSPSSGTGKHQSHSGSSVGVNTKDDDGVAYKIWLSAERLAGGGDMGTPSSWLGKKDSIVSNASSWLGKRAAGTASIDWVIAQVER